MNKLLSATEGSVLCKGTVFAHFDPAIHIHVGSSYDNSNVGMARIHLSSLINKIYGREDKGIIWRKLTVLVNTSDGTMVNFCAAPGCTIRSD